MAKITSPVAGFTGIGAGGLRFENGQAETDNPSLIAFFKRRGYGVGNSRPKQPEGPGEPADPREVATIRAGTPVRDGAVDPRSGDYLGPTNAGEANPHGPLVVNPEIHGSGPKPIHPGDVHVEDPAAQDAQETALTEATLVENQDVPTATTEAAQANDAKDAPSTFDPGEHTVDDVLAHLADADDDERARVLAAEETGKARKGILEA
jgi:hypothetical protein